MRSKPKPPQIDSNKERVHLRRMFLILIVATLLWVGVLGRLYWIQIGDTRTFSSHEIDLIQKSVTQRKRELVLDTGRGMVVDRYGRPFTGKTMYTLVVFPLAEYPFDKEPLLQELSLMTGMPKAALLSQIEEMKVPSVVNNLIGKPLELTKETAQQINSLQIEGIRAMPYNLRYSEEQLARHVIGYIGKNPELIRSKYAEELKQGLLTIDSRIGVAGLEKTFQPFLHGLGPTVVSYFVNAKGDPLRGLQIRYSQPENPYYPLTLITTLDYELQKAAEVIMDEVGIDEGAVVVLDIENADILAMASRPNYNPEQVNPNENNWSNRAVKQIIPGSVYKTVVAAAALETGLFQPDDTFTCNGELGKYGFHCWKEGGHGTLTLKEAFANSCNIAFAKVAMKLEGHYIEEFSRKLGLTEKIGHTEEALFHYDDFEQLDGEESGQLFVNQKDANDEGALVQTAIGQRDVRITPLQAANMIVTLHQRGKVYSPRLVKRIDYLNGTPFHTFPLKRLDEGREDRIDPYTGYELKKWMRSVVLEGTGTPLQKTIWPVAGKTGTAQVTYQNRELNNQWFVGYGPVEAPQVAVAVVAQHLSKYEERKAVMAFQRIMDWIAQNGI